MDICQNCGKEVETQGFRPKKFCNDSCRYEFHNKKKKEKRELEKKQSEKVEEVEKCEH